MMIGESVGEEKTHRRREEIQRRILSKRDRKREVLGKKLGETEEENTFS